MGCEVEEIDLGWTERVTDAFYAYARAFNFQPVDEMRSEDQAQLSDYIRYPSPREIAAGSMTFAAGVQVRAAMFESLGPILRSHHVLICPTLAVPGVPAEHSPRDASFTINGKLVDATLGWCMTFPFNMLSQLPAASVPNGFSPDGVPTGLQIVGRPFDDLSVFRAAAAFERARPWVHVHPR